MNGKRVLVSRLTWHPPTLISKVSRRMFLHSWVSLCKLTTKLRRWGLLQVDQNLRRTSPLRPGNASVHRCSLTELGCIELGHTDLIFSLSTLTNVFEVFEARGPDAFTRFSQGIIWPVFKVTLVTFFPFLLRLISTTSLSIYSTPFSFAFFFHQ